MNKVNGLGNIFPKPFIVVMNFEVCGNSEFLFLSHV